jgi:uncharacterized protein
MNLATAHKTIDFIIQEHLKQKNFAEEPLLINITGGEALTDFAKLENILDYYYRKAGNKGIKKAIVELSTNAVLLSEEKIEYFKNVDCVFFVGFDGIEKSFNKNRVLTSGEGAYSYAYRNIRKCIDMGLGNRIILNLVVTPNNVKYLMENFIFLHSLKTKSVSVTFAYNKPWNYFSLMTLKKKFSELRKVYIKYLEEDENFSIPLFDGMINRCLNPSESFRNICDAGKSARSIATDGTFMPCGGYNFNGDLARSLTIGNVFDGIDSKKLEDFRISLSQISVSECEDCCFNNKCVNYCFTINIDDSSDNIHDVPFSVCEINKIRINESEKLIDYLYESKKDWFLKRFVENKSNSNIEVI